MVGGGLVESTAALSSRTKRHGWICMLEKSRELVAKDK